MRPGTHSAWRRVPPCRRVVQALLLFAVSASCLGASAADDSKGDESEESELQQASRKMAESIQLVTIVEGTRRNLEMLKQPVLRFGDIPRANDKGRVWIWQDRGRPQAIMELYRAADGRSWVNVIHSLSVDKLAGDFGAGAPVWSTEQPGIRWSDFPDAAIPADRANVRARQIKDLAQKFSAHEFWDPNNSRYELRLLVQPVHKYSAPDAGLMDGAVFLICHENNPEVVLLIESVKLKDEQPRFRYALARLGHAELHVEFDTKEVWQQPRVKDTAARDPYFLFFKRN